MSKEFRSKGDSSEKTPQLLDSLEIVFGKCNVIFMSKEFRSIGVSYEKTPQLLDSLEIVLGRPGLFHV